MLRIFRSILRFVYRTSKKYIQKIALFTLSKVDDSFKSNYELNFKRQFRQNILIDNVEFDSQTCSSEKISLYTDTQNPLIINENGALISPEILQLTLASIFSDRCSKELLDQIWNYVLSNRDKCATHDELIKTLYTFLDNIFSSCEKEVIQARKEIARHVELTQNNRVCYSSETGKKLSTILWPDPTDRKKPRSIYDEIPFAKAYPIIDKFTPVGSAGSCFAVEIAHKLQIENFNYIITEENTNPNNKLSNSCAKWGTIFNAPSFRQLIERHLDNKPLPKLLWTAQSKRGLKFYDPFREEIEFGSIADFEESYFTHHMAAKQALLKAKVFILTLGMNEVWFLKSDGSVCSRSPWRVASHLVEKKILSVDENVFELQTMLNIWRKYNPDIQLIVSVSPVPLHATFRGDEYHVISANNHSKSTLRLVAEKFASINTGVYYFPSFETVIYCTKHPWQQDQRHVSQESVENVMKLFNKMFVKN